MPIPCITKCEWCLYETVDYAKTSLSNRATCLGWKWIGKKKKEEVDRVQIAYYT